MSAFKACPADVNSSTYIDFSIENNGKGPIFEVVDLVRISKYKNIFAKDYVPIWSKKVFMIKKLKDTVMWKNVISDLNDEEIVRTFYEKNYKKESKRVQS